MIKKSYIIGGMLMIMSLFIAGCTETTEVPAEEESEQEVLEEETTPSPQSTLPEEDSDTTEQTKIVRGVPQSQTPSTPQEVVQPPKEVVQEPQEATVAANCDAFPDKLSTCTKYKCRFIHPFTKETMEKEIKGIIAGRCNYIEEMPNNGKFECNYTESQRIVAAQYYKDIAEAESFGVRSKIDFFGDKEETTYTIDGKEVGNPLQTFINDGTCGMVDY